MAAAIGTASIAPTRPPTAPPTSRLRMTRNGEIPTVLRITGRHQHVALEELQDDVHAGDDEGELRRHRRGDQDRGDRAEERADERDRLGDGGDQAEDQRARDAEDRVGDRRRRPHGGHQDELAADPQAEPLLDVVPDLARPSAALGGNEREDIPLQAGVLDEPEVDERQEGQGRDDGLRDRESRPRRPARSSAPSRRAGSRSSRRRRAVP